MELNITKIVWVIVSKDRKFIAKGVPRDRCLVRIDDEKDTKRILTYASKGKAESGFKTSGFYGQQEVLGGWDSGNKLEDVLEAIPVEISMKELTYKM
jgi:hypothetical protein